MEEAQTVVDLEASPLSDSMQPQLDRAKMNEVKNLTISEEAHIVVDVKASALSESMQRELNILWGNRNAAKNFTIFRTPQNISERKKNLFEPSVISIGPLHHGQKHLQSLKELKWQFLQDFLSRGDHISLDLCISEMKMLEKRTRRCYSEPFGDLSSNTFVEMMLLDGCFVLEYFSIFLEKEPNSYNTSKKFGWKSRFIELDLLLLENQIPFFIVEKLYEIGNLNQKLPRMNFVKSLALALLLSQEGSISLDPAPEITDPLDYIDYIIPDPPAEIHHLVHLFYHYLVPNLEKPVVLISKSFDLTTMFSANRIKRLLAGRFPHSISRSLSVALTNSTGNISSMVIPSATELKQKGLQFTPKSNPKHMLDISFEYGVLKIPKLAITDATKLIFSNHIAFEHSKNDLENTPFTRFVAFLDNLVNTPNDVTILQECGIIENWLGSEEELCNFINQVTEYNIFETDHYLAELYTEVNRYSESSWNRQRAKLIRDYFSSPWAAISLVAALILLVLTCVQSFYAVYAYKFPPSS